MRVWAYREERSPEVRQPEYRAEFRQYRLPDGGELFFPAEETTDIFSLSLGSIVFKEMTLALMEPRTNHVCHKLIKLQFNRVFDPAALYQRSSRHNGL